MNVAVEKGGPFAYEFNPTELVIDTHEIYKRAIQICELEATEEKSPEDVARLIELRRITGYIGGYELDYRIEGFDFIRWVDSQELQLLTFLSPMIDEHEGPTDLFGHGEVYGLFYHQLKEGKGVGGKIELKIHEFDDSGDEFVTKDRFYTLHPIVTPIWEPYKAKRVKEVLEENPDRELIDLS